MTAKIDLLTVVWAARSQLAEGRNLNECFSSRSIQVYFIQADSVWCISSVE
jgi:hypothetical protein